MGEVRRHMQEEVRFSPNITIGCGNAAHAHPILRPALDGAGLANDVWLVNFGSEFGPPRKERGGLVERKT